MRNERSISLQEAVRKMTSLPANRLDLRQRGLISKGYYADLCIFSLDKIEDKATFKKPHQYAEGIEHVIVNGTFVIENCRRNGKTPGKLIRNKFD